MYFDVAVEIGAFMSITQALLEERIEKAIEEHGTQSKAAAALGLRAVELSDVRRRKAGRSRMRKVAAALNLVPVQQMDQETLAWKIRHRT